MAAFPNRISRPLCFQKCKIHQPFAEIKFSMEKLFFSKNVKNVKRKKTNIIFSKIAANKCAKKIPQFVTNTSELDPCFVVISLHFWRGKKYEFAKN